MDITPTWAWTVKEAIRVLQSPSTAERYKECMADELRRLAEAVDEHQARIAIKPKAQARVELRKCDRDNYSLRDRESAVQRLAAITREKQVNACECPEGLPTGLFGTERCLPVEELCPSCLAWLVATEDAINQLDKEN